MLMAMWGRFLFGINTAAFQELQRTTSWRWVSQDLFGQMPTLQFIGDGADQITLPGVIYPEWRGGVGQIEDMRAIAGTGAPQILLDGRGNILGKWVCTGITEKQSNFAGFGFPLKQEFTITLERFADPLSGNVVLKVLSAKTGVNLSAIKNMISQVKSAVGQIQTVVASAQAVVSTATALIGAPAAIITAELNKVSRVGESMKDLATTAASLAGPRPTNATAIAGLQTLVTGLPTLVAQATASAVKIKSAVETVIANAGPLGGIVAATSALVASNRLTAYGSSAYHATKAEVTKVPLT